MSYRKIILTTNEIYHAYNRGVEKRPIFLLRKDYLRFIALINYYRFANCPIKFSHFKELPVEERKNILNKLDKESKKLVDVIAFCLMQNHVHFLLQSVPTYSCTKIITIIKSITAKEIFQRFPEVKKQLWGGEFWTDGYFVNTVSRFGDETTISKYVKEQGIEKEYKMLHKTTQLTIF